MSILDTVLAAHADLPDDQDPLEPWVDAFIAAATDVVPQLPWGAQAATRSALIIVKAHALTLEKTTAAEFLGTVVKLALGDELAAKLLWLRDHASFEERMAAMDQADDATRKAMEERETEWTTIREVALTLLRSTGPVILSMLIAL